jgi:hypothetical protein
MQQIGNDSSSAGSFFTSVAQFGNATGLQFPILSNPVIAFEMMLGQRVTLFTFTLPTLSINDTEDYDFPIWAIPPVVGVIEGTLDLSATATFGYDTSGLLAGKPEDGLFIQNAHVSINMSLSLGAGPGIPDVAVLALNGGVDGQVNFSLTGPGGDTTVYGSQLLAGDFSIQESGSLGGFFNIQLRVYNPATLHWSNVINQSLGQETFFTYP